MKQLFCLLVSMAMLCPCVGCAKLKDWRARQTAKARGEAAAAGPAAPGTASQPAFPLRQLAAPRPSDGPSIAPDVMSVNGLTITTADVLEPIWGQLERMAQTAKPDEYPELSRRLVRDGLRETINELLVWYEIKNKLEQKKEALDKAVEGRLRDRINQGFEGSQAKFERYLAARGLSLEGYKQQEARRLVVAQYLREEIVPQIHVSRRQMWSYYNENRRDFETPARVKLQMIDVPDRAFLARDKRDDPVARIEARRQAHETIRQALVELQAGTDFADVARKHSRGPNASNGGRWDWVSEEPGLQGRWAQPGRAAFSLEAGTHSDVIETADGFFIVRVEDKVPAQRKTFEDVQEQIEQQMREVTFDRLSTDFLLRLIAKAYISSNYEPFRDRLYALVPKVTQPILTTLPTALGAGPSSPQPDR